MQARSKNDDIVEFQQCQTVVKREEALLLASWSKFGQQCIVLVTAETAKLVGVAFLLSADVMNRFQ